jgi:hypothetical protein
VWGPRWAPYLSDPVGAAIADLGLGVLRAAGRGITTTTRWAGHAFTDTLTGLHTPTRVTPGQILNPHHQRWHTQIGAINPGGRSRFIDTLTTYRRVIPGRIPSWLNGIIHLEIQTPEGRIMSTGTGFLYDRDMVLTARHVIERSNGDPGLIQAHFRMFHPRATLPDVGLSSRKFGKIFLPKETFPETAFDYAGLRLSGPVPKGYRPLELAPFGNTPPGTPVYSLGYLGLGSSEIGDPIAGSVYGARGHVKGPEEYRYEPAVEVDSFDEFLDAEAVVNQRSHVSKWVSEFDLQSEPGVSGSPILRGKKAIGLVGKGNALDYSAEGHTTISPLFDESFFNTIEEWKHANR